MTRKQDTEIAEWVGGWIAEKENRRRPYSGSLLEIEQRRKKRMALRAQLRREKKKEAWRLMVTKIIDKTDKSAV